MLLANIYFFFSAVTSLDTSKKAVDMVVTHIKASDHVYGLLFMYMF